MGAQSLTRFHRGRGGDSANLNRGSLPFPFPFASPFARNPHIRHHLRLQKISALRRILQMGVNRA